MAHIAMLNGKDDTLLCVLDPNEMLLAQFVEQGEFLDEAVEQDILAKPTDYMRNKYILQWLRNNSQEVFDAFIRTLRINGQAHVANYITDSPGK